MYQIQLIVKGAVQPLALNYKFANSSQLWFDTTLSAAHSKVTVKLEDDFDRHVYLDGGDIISASLVNVKHDMAAQHELQYLGQVVQAQKASEFATRPAPLKLVNGG